MILKKSICWLLNHLKCTDPFSAFTNAEIKDRKHGFYYEINNSGEVQYHATDKKTSDCKKIDKLPSGSLRAKKLSVRFLKKYLTSKTHLSLADIASLQEFTIENSRFWYLGYITIIIHFS